MGQHRAGRNSIDGKPFQQGLLVIFGRLEDRGGVCYLKRHRRSTLGRAMEYAQLNDVPPELYGAFVKQARMKKIPAKLKAEHQEPGFVALKGKRV